MKFKLLFIYEIACMHSRKVICTILYRTYRKGKEGHNDRLPSLDPMMREVLEGIIGVKK